MRQITQKTNTLKMNSNSTKSKPVPSIIKWTGSKRKQVGTILEHVPQHNRYVEPFLGGGAVLFFHTKNSLASDIYKPLIDFWKIVQSNPSELIKNYKQQWESLQKGRRQVGVTSQHLDVTK